MSELKVDTIRPRTSGNTKVVVTPSIRVKDFEVTPSGEIKVLAPLRVGSSTSNSSGNASDIAPEVLTSRGTNLSPVWSAGIPFGSIIMWYGLISNIPPGWVLCDGKTNIIGGISWTTPNLTDSFIRSVGEIISFREIGGASSHTFLLRDSDIPPHRHFMTISSPCDTPGFTNYGYNQLVTYLGDPHELEQKGPPDGTRTCYWHIKTGLPDASGVQTPITIPTIPQYHALCFIMRVPTS